MSIVKTAAMSICRHVSMGKCVVNSLEGNIPRNGIAVSYGNYGNLLRWPNTFLNWLQKLVSIFKVTVVFIF